MEFIIRERLIKKRNQQNKKYKKNVKLRAIIPSFVDTIRKFSTQTIDQINSTHLTINHPHNYSDAVAINLTLP